MTALTDANPTKVNVNTASETELETLPGVGPVTAEKQALADQVEGQHSEEHRRCVGGEQPECVARPDAFQAFSSRLRRTL